MKRILCHLAQRNPHPAGPLAKHVSRCQDCKEFFEQVSSLESRLVTTAGEPDRHLCDEIMASIPSKKPATFTTSRWAWFSSPIALSSATALVFSLIGFLAITNFKKPAQVANGPAEQANPPAPPAPEASREMTLAYAQKQQEFLQRDALKLGAHLRENLIMFRTKDQ